ncbi:MAG: DUF4130 domain-containing protein [Clostridia bacterium]|jgi:probable DNA metabolism protein|nr:DUF4130 domain-containing protein [Clostridia bacterium]
MKIFIVNGAESFFTAVFIAYKEKDCIITSDGDVQLSLGCEVVRVAADGEKCGRIVNAIKKYDGEALYDISLVLRSCDPLKEQTVFGYIKRLFNSRAPVKKAMNLPEVVDFNDLLYKVNGETHRLKGLLRFMECEGGALYAPYSPDNDVTDLLMQHFAERFKSERFIIHDLKRKIAGMYDGHEWFTGYAEEAEVQLSKYERGFENLWKKYYKAVNIIERPHDKQMKRSMPVRYWKFLPEKQ